MNIGIRNIGKVAEAEIMVDGITVIAGENNTGKSTIGKTVFCLLYQMNHWHDIYLNECTDYLLPIINNHVNKLKGILELKDGPMVSSIRNLVEEFFSREAFIQELVDEQELIRKSEHIVNSAHPLMRELDAFLERYSLLYQGENIKYLIDHKENEIDEWKRKLIYSLRDGKSLFQEFIQADYIENSFNIFFHGQYLSTVMSKEDYCAVTYENEGIYHRLSLTEAQAMLSKALTENIKVFYIDTPEVYDRLSLNYEKSDGLNTSAILERILIPNYVLTASSDKGVKKKNFGNINRQWPQEAINNLIHIKNCMYKIMKGKAEQSKSGLKYADPEAGSIFPHNVSMGIKHIAFFEHIIRERAIGTGDIIILDEPEINLHPEWQVEYARTLVLLEKYLKVKFIITSHSPYFIRAIECFSDIYGEMDNLNIYKPVSNGRGGVTFENIMESEFGTPELYEEYTRQYAMLQDEVDRSKGEEDK